jgi:hypothetical protein
MKMMTKEIEKRIPGFGESEKDSHDARVHVKFFSPWTGWSWYATEYDPRERRFYGFVEGDFPEFGYFSLDELESVDAMPGVPAVERDKYWDWKTTIGDVVEAVERGEHL